MSSRDFDNYLLLLGKFLGLNGSQRDAIAGELSDHFEERLSELESHGVAHERAVRIAVEEFGDAAGLASRFLSLSRNSRRRWIMRCTAFSLTGALTALILVTAFWPHERTGPGPAPAAAQNQPGAGAVGGASGGGGAGQAGVSAAPTIEENNAATEAKLAERMPADFMETTLSDVVRFLSDMKGIEIYVDEKALSESGVSMDVPVSLSLKNVRGDMLLDLLLKQAGGLTYVVRDGIVVISTVDALQAATEVRVYNCRDLLGLAQVGYSSGYPGGLLQPQPHGYPTSPGGPTSGTPIPSATGPSGLAPSAAAPSGGAAGLPPLPGTGGLPPGTTPPTGAAEPVSDATAPTGAAPKRKDAANFDPRTTLRQVSGGAGFGPTGPGEAGTGGPGPGSLGPGGGLGGPGEGAFGNPGAGGLGDAMGGMGIPGMGGMGMGSGMYGAAEPNASYRLTSIIESSVYPDSWANAGGSGTIGEYGGLLVINNNVRAHRQVEALLDMLREAAAKQPGATIRGR